MSFRRYEITLPTQYNDGSRVEQEKFLLVSEELTEQFGAYTLQWGPVRGAWTSEGRLYEELNVRIFVDVEDTLENAAFFARYKQILKERFRQIDIWIVSFEIRLT